MNYFQQQNIHWYDYTPEDIYIKSNMFSNKLNDINTVSYKNKTDFYQSYPWGVAVALTNIKSEFPCADLDFNKYNGRYGALNGNPIQGRIPKPRLDSQGNQCETQTHSLVYIHSKHYKYEWKQDYASGQWQNIQQSQVPLQDQEGYTVSIGGQGATFGGNERAVREMVDISFAVVNFLIERVLPLKRKKSLTMVA
tara:strand:+ start:67263 stop:67847 length:585 start_codon:yes stop_codon:yes gene_type:complete